MTLADGRLVSQIIDLEKDSQPLPEDATVSNLARMAMSQTLGSEDEKEAVAIAVRYQLISRHTNFLFVDERSEEDKGEGLPKLCKVPQMLVAGWGGTGTITSRQDIRFSKAAQSCGVDEPGIMYCQSAPQRDSGIRFSVRVSQEEIDERRQRTTPSSFMYKCDLRNGRSTTWLKAELQLSTYADLLACDLPDLILDALTNLAEHIDPRPSEAQVVLAFLLVLHETAQDYRFNRTTARSLKKARKKIRPSQQLLDRIKDTFPNINRENWGASFSYSDEPEFE